MVDYWLTVIKLNRPVPTHSDSGLLAHSDQTESSNTIIDAPRPTNSDRSKFGQRELGSARKT